MTGTVRRSEKTSSDNSAYPERERVTSHLTELPDRSVRLLFAPVGAGKTTALKHYIARVTGTKPFYQRLLAGTSIIDFPALLSARETENREIIFDDLDAATPAVIEELVNYIVQRRDSRRYLLAGRSPLRMHADELMARGVAVELKATTLAFAVDEAAALATTYGITYDFEDIAQLVSDTDGWAIGTEWVLRNASYEGHPLRRAYEVWRETRGHHLLRYVASQIERDGDSFADFRACFLTGRCETHDEFQRCVALGFPLVRTQTGWRPYRLLLPESSDDAATSTDDVDPLAKNPDPIAQLRCDIGECEVALEAPRQNWDQSRERRREPELLRFDTARPERRAERRRVTSLIGHLSGSAARIVCAPLGCGKTAALQHYVGNYGGKYLDVRSLVAKSRDDADSIFVNLPTLSNEIVLDNLDAAPAAAIDALIERIASGADRRKYILSGRSRQRMRVSRLIALGIGTLIEAPAFAFDMTEAAQLADRHRLKYDNEDLAQLLHDTEGWPIAVHKVMREAIRHGSRLSGAFESWRQSRGHLLAEFVAAEHESDTDEYLRFTVLLRRGFEGAGEALERFEALGFPVGRQRTALRPYRVLSRLANNTTEVMAGQRPDTHPLMTLKLLGRFRCEIDGRPLAFVRRRDQNVFAFVALSSNGRASRRQILEAFWSGVGRDAAAQGLRTTLSRIRQAIGQIVGPELVDLYFRSADDISIDSEHVTLDFRRFLEHLALARIAEEKGDTATAKLCYSNADRLYGDQLLASEAVARCFTPYVVELEEKYVAMLSRLFDLYSGSGEEDAAQACMAKLLRRAATQSVANIAARESVLS